LKKNEFCLGYDRGVFCMHCEEKISLEASRCF
jgi:hypothetical protein